MDEIIINIIDNLAKFLSYFVPGFIFLSCYQYVACLPREKEKEYLVIKSIAGSFFLNLIGECFQGLWNMNGTSSLTFTIVLTMLLGFIFGKLHKAEWVSRLFQFCFGRELDNNIFVELWVQSAHKGKVLSVEIALKNSNKIYLGQVHKVIQYNTDPIVILRCYMCIDSDEKIISDKTEKEDSYIVIRYSDIEKLEYDLLS